MHLQSVSSGPTELELIIHLNNLFIERLKKRDVRAILFIKRTSSDIRRISIFPSILRRISLLHPLITFDISTLRTTVSLANNSFLPILIKYREPVDGYRFYSNRLRPNVKHCRVFCSVEKKIGSSVKWKITAFDSCLIISNLIITHCECVRLLIIETRYLHIVQSLCLATVIATTFERNENSKENTMF